MPSMHILHCILLDSDEKKQFIWVFIKSTEVEKYMSDIVETYPRSMAITCSKIEVTL